jgi:hypothetical protein
VFTALALGCVNIVTTLPQFEYHSGWETHEVDIRRGLLYAQVGNKVVKLPHQLEMSARPARFTNSRGPARAHGLSRSGGWRVRINQL